MPSRTERALEQPHPVASSPPIGDLPLVSVGLPVFNGAPYLESCLESLLAQTYRHFELIISDNASTDETVRICERYATRDSRIRFHRAERNRGAAWNHNHVRELARGTFFKWCGVDDLIAPRFLETCVDVLRRSPDAVLAYPMSVVIDETGETVARTADRLDLDALDPVIRFRSLLKPWSVTHNPFYGVMRTASLAAVRPIGTFFANDRSLLAELALRGPFVRVEEYLMYRRRHAYRPPHVEGHFFDPDRARGYWAREWRMLREHVSSVLRTPGGVRAKLRLLGVAAAWALEQRAILIGEIFGLVAHLARRSGIRRFRASY
jgi:glycosyltransferase involved in cell wall biosynthesis